MYFISVVKGKDLVLLFSEFSSCLCIHFWRLQNLKYCLYCIAAVPGASTSRLKSEKDFQHRWILVLWGGGGSVRGLWREIIFCFIPRISSSDEENSICTNLFLRSDFIVMASAFCLNNVMWVCVQELVSLKLEIRLPTNYLFIKLGAVYMSIAFLFWIY